MPSRVTKTSSSTGGALPIRACCGLSLWRLDDLLPSPRNARTYSEAQVAEIAGSIRTFGFSNPILVGEDRDVDRRSWTLGGMHASLVLSEVPVIVLGSLSQVREAPADVGR